MNNTVKRNVLISFVMAIHFTGCLAMEQAKLSIPPAPPYQAVIQTFFLPQSQEYICERLTSLLNNAKNQILIAMYWLTDEVILAKLFALKARGIDVQIILDGTTPNPSRLITQLLKNNIIPVVLLDGVGGIMHNKYVIIDNNFVWTGSANFTKVVLAPKGDYINDENVVIIESRIAAEQYRNAFYLTQDDILKTSISVIAKTNRRNLPDWLIPLCKKLYRSNKAFKDVLKKSMPQFMLSQQESLRSLFPDQEEMATNKQRVFLESRGIDSKNISKRDAIKLIRDIMMSEQDKRYRPY